MSPGVLAFSTAALLFSIAAEEYLKMKEAGWEAKTRLIAKNNLVHLLPIFGKRLLVDIEAPKTFWEKNGKTVGEQSVEGQEQGFESKPSGETVERSRPQMSWL